MKLLEENFCMPARLLPTRRGRIYSVSCSGLDAAVRTR